MRCCLDRLACLSMIIGVLCWLVWCKQNWMHLHVAQSLPASVNVLAKLAQQHCTARRRFMSSFRFCSIHLCAQRTPIVQRNYWIARQYGAWPSQMRGVNLLKPNATRCVCAGANTHSHINCISSASTYTICVSIIGCANRWQSNCTTERLKCCALSTGSSFLICFVVFRQDKSGCEISHAIRSKVNSMRGMIKCIVLILAFKYPLLVEIFIE